MQSSIFILLPSSSINLTFTTVFMLPNSMFMQSSIFILYPPRLINKSQLNTLVTALLNWLQSLFSHQYQFKYFLFKFQQICFYFNFLPLLATLSIDPVLFCFVIFFCANLCRPSLCFISTSETRIPHHILYDLGSECFSLINLTP